MSPFPLTAGKRIAADDLNDLLPDGMAFSTYTPVLRSSGTQPTLGTGSVVHGRYYRLGRLLFLYVRIQFGTSGVGAGTGDYYVSLPLNTAPRLSEFGFRMGRGTAYDASTNTSWVIDAAAPIGVNNEFLFIPDRAGVVGAGIPFAWAANDRLDFSAFYEVAA
ncbi:MAG: hypothetical protein M3N32_07785 [Actinomycetota bacterium]|nr:hypothetical protein [Actinomycetota bacterium]